MDRASGDVFEDDEDEKEDVPGLRLVQPYPMREPTARRINRSVRRTGGVRRKGGNFEDRVGWVGEVEEEEGREGPRRGISSSRSAVMVSVVRWVKKMLFVDKGEISVCEKTKKEYEKVKIEVDVYNIILD